VRLLCRMVDIGSNENDIILDFFAGSATTAHAVLELNKEDGGNRKFICVQIPEPTDEKSEASKAGYKNIAEIGKERIRRAGKAIVNAQLSMLNDLNGQLAMVNGQLEEVLSGNMFPDSDPQLLELKAKQSELQEKINHLQSTIDNLDTGFKVFKLSKSNFKIWDSVLEKEPEVIQAKLFEHIQHISPAAEQEAILFELLLKSGFELTTPIEKLTLAGLTVFSIAEGQLLICLEKELTHDCIKAMAEMQPTRVICLDEGFKGENADALKTNAVQIMKSKGVVNFRTV